MKENIGKAGNFPLFFVDIGSDFSYNENATHLHRITAMGYMFIGKNVRSVFATIVE